MKVNLLCLDSWHLWVMMIKSTFIFFDKLLSRTYRVPQYTFCFHIRKPHQRALLIYFPTLILKLLFAIHFMFTWNFRYIREIVSLMLLSLKLCMEENQRQFIFLPSHKIWRLFIEKHLLSSIQFSSTYIHLFISWLRFICVNIPLHQISFFLKRKSENKEAADKTCVVSCGAI